MACLLYLPIPRGAASSIGTARNWRPAAIDLRRCALGFGSPVLLATINFDAVTLFADHNQEKMRDVARHYGRDVRIRFNQHNCLFTLESRSADLSVDEVMRQFGLVSRRDYFAQNDPGAR